MDVSQSKSALKMETKIYIGIILDLKMYCDADFYGALAE